MGINNQIVKILTPYRKMYPQSRIDVEGIAMYATFLSGYSAAAISAAMAKLTLTCKFFPSVAEIVAAIDDIKATAMGNEEKEVDEAWREVIQQVHDAFVYKKPSFSTPEIERAALNMGWTSLCNLGTNEMNTARAQFRDIYKNIVTKKRNKETNQTVLDTMPAAKVQELIGRVTELKTIDGGKTA